MSFDPKILTRINDARRRREAVILMTDLEAETQSLITTHDLVDLDPSLSVQYAERFRSGKSGLVSLDSGREVFLTVMVPSPRLVIIGAVHISQALAPMARMAGLDVTIIDPRTAFATPERFDGISLFAEWPDEVLPSLELDAYTAMVAVTHDPKIDDMPLITALEANCFYIGALGSRKTHAKRLGRLQSAGVTDEKLDRIHAPIGLNIGAASPAEIAVAILAEIIQSLRSPKTPKKTGA